MEEGTVAYVCPTCGHAGSLTITDGQSRSEGMEHRSLRPDEPGFPGQTFCCPRDQTAMVPARDQA